MLNSGSSCLSSSPNWGYCVVMFFSKTLGGNPVIDYHLIQGGGVEILLVTSCDRNQDKLWPDGPLG